MVNFHATDNSSTREAYKILDQLLNTGEDVSTFRDYIDAKLEKLVLKKEAFNIKESIANIIDGQKDKFESRNITISNIRADQHLSADKN